MKSLPDPERCEGAPAPSSLGCCSWLGNVKERQLRPHSDFISPKPRKHGIIVHTYLLPGVIVRTDEETVQYSATAMEKHNSHLRADQRRLVYPGAE